MKNSIVDFLEESVTKFGEKIAIEDGNGTLTFSELRENALIVGAHLKRYDLSNQPVPIFLEKSKECITAFVGTNYSGNFYVPLDVTSPKLRLVKILDNLDSSVIITDRKHAPIFNEIPRDISVLIIEDMMSSQTSQASPLILSKPPIDTDPAYCIYTSGSTGTPKGVLISHRSVIDYISWAIDLYGVNREEVIGNQAPFHFDNSTLDIYLTLATGAKLVLIPQEKFTYPYSLIEFLNEKEITFVFWVPSVLVSIANLDTFESILPESLKKVLFAGEVMPNKHLNYWRKYLSNILFSNLYGPTEITVDCTYYIIDRQFSDDSSLPIGIPCANTDVFLLDDSDRLVYGDGIGEICVRGSSLALGYYNNQEQTDIAFVQNPLNGCFAEKIYRTGDLAKYNELGELIFLGRKDSQIKHMGYRIELGEIEAALIGLKEIDNVCVLYKAASKKLVAFYVGDENFKLIRRLLIPLLPKYMIPNVWINMKSLPHNANGKIDRLKLAEFEVDIS